MKRTYILTFSGLVLSSMYLIFLIIQDRYQDFRVNNYITTLELKTQLISNKIKARESDLAYASTPSFVDRIAKSSQNLNNPGEEVFILVLPDENIPLNETVNLKISSQSNQQEKNQLKNWKEYIFTKKFPQ